MQNIYDFISKNLKTIVLIVGFLVSFYVQSVTNTQTISELKTQCIGLEIRLSKQDEQINTLKIDRAAYQSTVEQVSLVREDIKELRTDVKELLKKR